MNIDIKSLLTLSILILNSQYKDGASDVNVSGRASIIGHYTLRIAFSIGAIR